jgi:hypothetical protein
MQMPQEGAHVEPQGQSWSRTHSARQYPRTSQKAPEQSLFTVHFSSRVPMQPFATRNDRSNVPTM